jgi:hypothetical protein
MIVHDAGCNAKGVRSQAPALWHSLHGCDAEILRAMRTAAALLRKHPVLGQLSSFRRKLAPAKAGAGIQAGPFAWTPAFAGVTPEFLASETGSYRSGVR